MLNSKHIRFWISLLLIVLLAGCKTYDIPDAYDIRPSDLKTNVYGCWSSFELGGGADSLSKSLSGELICIEADTVYLLTSDYGITPILVNDIEHFKVYTHKRQEKTYAGMTMLFLAPSWVGAIIYAAEYGGSFLALGIPMAVVGLTHIFIEGSSEKNMITHTNYPGFREMSVYARYPGGKPVDTDLNQLTIKK